MKRILTAVALVLATASISQAAVVRSEGTTVGGAFTTAAGTIVASNNPAYFQGATTPASEWIWINQGTLATRPNTPITFEFKFDLSDYVLSSAKLSGLWGIDNIGTVVLNGTTILSNLPTAVTANFNFLTAFTATSGFVAGMNTLAFNVANTGGPAGFRAAVTVEASPVPLPAGGVLLLTALAGFAALRRRKAA